MVNLRPTYRSISSPITKTLSVEHIGNSALPPKFTGVEAKTDGEGKFSISNVPSPCTIVVFDLAGYLEERHTAPEAGLELKLRGLGALNGKLLTGSSPGSRERIEAHNALLPHLAFPRTFSALWFRAQTHTDSSGAFVLSNLPPIALELHHAVRFPASTNDFLTSQNTRVDIPEGDSFKITLGGKGGRMVGRIELESFEQSFDWPIQSQIISAVVPRPLALQQIDRQVAEFDSVADSIKADPSNRALSENVQKLGSTIERAVDAFYESSEGQSYNPRRQFSLIFSRDGSFRVDDLPPGNYSLDLVFRERPTIPGIPAPQLARLQQTITVPINESSDPFDLGTISVAPTITALPIGSTAPDFAVNDLNGKPFKLSDFKGRFILLEFWAVWCAPCKGEIPYLKQTYDTFKSDDRFAMISLSLDENPQIAREFVGEQSLEWNQGYLGEWPPGPVAKSYQVLGVPSIYLIGPDGKVLANRLRGPATKQAVSAALSWQTSVIEPTDRH